MLARSPEFDSLSAIKGLSPNAQEVALAMKEVGEHYERLRLHLINLVSPETISQVGADPDFPIVKTCLSVDRPSVIVPRLDIAHTLTTPEVTLATAQARDVLKSLLDDRQKYDAIMQRYLALRPANRALVPHEYEDWLVQRQLKVEDAAHEANIRINTRMCTRNFIIFDFYRPDEISRWEANRHYDESLGLFAVRTLGELTELVRLSHLPRRDPRSLGTLGERSCVIGGQTVVREFIYNRGLSIFHDCQVGLFSQVLLQTKVYDLTRLLLITDLLAAFDIPLNTEAVMQSFASNNRSPDPCANIGIVNTILRMALTAQTRGVSITPQMASDIFSGKDLKAIFRSSMKGLPAVVNVPAESPQRTPQKTVVAIPQVSSTEEFEAVVQAAVMRSSREISHEEKRRMLKLSKLYSRKGVISKEGGEDTLSLSYIEELISQGATCDEVIGVIQDYLRHKREKNRLASQVVVKEVLTQERKLDASSRSVAIQPPLFVVTEDAAIDRWMQSQSKGSARKIDLVRATIKKLSILRPRDEKKIGGSLDKVYRCHIPGASELRLLYQRRGDEVRVLKVILRQDLDQEIRNLYRSL